MIRIMKMNRRVRDPYARWCGRRGAVRRLPIPIKLYGVTLQELLILLVIIFVSALFSYKSSKLKVAVVAILTNYLMLLVYWAVGIYLNDEYEPEMVIGWLIFASLTSFFVVPASITFAWAMRKLNYRFNNAT